MKRTLRLIKPTIKYSGSLIQQNHAEALEHGFVIWDSKTKTTEFVTVDNDIVYYTVDINNGIYEPLPDKLLNKRIRLRARVNNTNSADVIRILAEIQRTHTIEESTVQRVSNNDFTRSKLERGTVKDIRDVEYQNELITKYVKEKYAASDDIVDTILHINRLTNSGLPKLDSTRNISWTPKRFEFSNMFSYGPDNVIDFQTMRGVNGLFAPNASGKSTLLDAITYCIYDKCSRTSKSNHVINTKAPNFQCKFTFSLDDVDYVIEKKGTRGRGDHVRIDIDFYKMDGDDKISMNGKERSDTNDIIRRLLGTYEDFVLTALSVQNNNAGFIDMSQKDRKDLLAKFLDIEIFEDLWVIATSEIREVNTLIKDHQRKNYAVDLVDARQRVNTYSDDIIRIQSDLDKLRITEQSISDKLLELNRELIPVKIKQVNLSELESDLSKTESKIVSLQTIKDSADIELSEIRTKLNSIDSVYNQFDLVTIECDINVRKKLQIDESKKCIQIQSLETELKHKRAKLDKLSDLKYDPNCEFCMDNVFVKDAIQTKELIQGDIDSLASAKADLQLILESISKTDKSLEHKEKLDKVIDLRKSYESKLSSQQLKISGYVSDISKLESKKIDLERSIAEYKLVQDSINSNVIINNKIDKLMIEHKSVKSTIEQYSKDLSNLQSKKSVADSDVIRITDNISRLDELLKKFKSYEYYLDAVSRDGIPYQLISSAVPYIEQEINSILSQIVPFSVMLEMDGKNINCHIVYDTDTYWPIELASGMEKFISSLAIRTSLINMSSLPSPNFLAIDEGFGVLDSENMSSILGLFEYLKTQFSFILIISHIDSMRDYTDNLIEINKLSTGSKIISE